MSFEAAAGQDRSNISIGAAAEENWCFKVPVTRILVFSVLSWGLYYFYWMFLTWKQYRDHRQVDAYPVWHALTQFVPFYCLFRVHAHARTYKELMESASIRTTISPSGAVAAVLLFNAVSWQSFSFVGAVSQGEAVATLILEIVSVLIATALVYHLQGNLNAYWNSQAPTGMARTKGISLAEIVFVVLGLLAWADTFAMVLSSSYRMA